MNRHCSTSPTTRFLKTISVSSAAAWSLAPPTAKKHATSRRCSTSPASRVLGTVSDLEGSGVVAGTAYSKIAWYVQALQHQPDNASACNNLAGEALQHQPDDTVSRYNLGVEGGVVVAGTAYS